MSDNTCPHCGAHVLQADCGCPQEYPSADCKVDGCCAPSPSTPRTEGLPPRIARRMASTNEQPCDHGKPFFECAPCLYEQLVWERDGLQAYCDSENAMRASLTAACAERDAAREEASVNCLKWNEAIERMEAERDAARAEAERLRGALSDLAGAAIVVYTEDDAFTAWREGDGREHRDDKLGEAIDRAVQALAVNDGGDHE